MTSEYDRFSKVIADHAGLPIDDDNLAATTVRDLVLDMGYDPYWAAKVLLSALDMVGQTFELDTADLVHVVMRSD